MSLMETLKTLFSKTAGNASEETVKSLLNGLVGKLDGVDGLDTKAEKALAALKTALGGKVDVEKLLAKAKELIASLNVDSLPEDVKGIVEKVTALLK